MLLCMWYSNAEISGFGMTDLFSSDISRDYVWVSFDYEQSIDCFITVSLVSVNIVTVFS